MKTLEEIKHEISNSSEHISFYSRLFNMSTQEQIVFWDKVAKEYADECAREALRLASESAKTFKNGNGGSWHDASVNKQSILSETNLPKHI